MKIVVNCVSFQKNSDAFTKYYLQKVFAAICVLQKADEFIFLVNEDCKGEFLFSPNAKEIVLNYSKSKIALAAFYNVKLPLLLKKNKADIVLQAFAKTAATNIPQVLIVENFSEKKITKAIAEKAKQIVAFSQFTKSKLLEKQNTLHDKLSVVSIAINAAEEFLSAKTKEAIAEKQFFLFKDIESKTDYTFIVLKAFSQFKKRMQCSMQLSLILSSEKKKTNGRKTENV